MVVFQLRRRKSSHPNYFFKNVMKSFVAEKKVAI